MLYNVLQVCHGGHSLGVIYVTTPTALELREAKKCKLVQERGGGEGKHQTWSSVISSPI